MLKPYNSIYLENLAPSTPRDTYIPNKDEIDAIVGVIEIYTDYYISERHTPYTGNKVLIDENINAVDIRDGWAFINLPGSVKLPHIEIIKKKYKVPLDLFYKAVNINTHNSDPEYLKNAVENKLKKIYTESGWTDVKLTHINIYYHKGETEKTPVRKLARNRWEEPVGSTISVRFELYR